MDKLEFDARLAHLERRVALLSALILGGLAVLGLSLMLLTSHASARPNPPVFVSTPAPAAPPAPMRAVADFAEGSVGNLSNQLRDLADLNRKTLLTNTEYEAKKQQLLEKRLRSTDLKAELELLADLRKQNIIKDEEFRTIKGKLLEIGK